MSDWNVGTYNGPGFNPGQFNQRMRMAHKVGKAVHNWWQHRQVNKRGRPLGSKNKPKPAKRARPTTAAKRPVYAGRHVLPAGQRSIRGKPRRAISKAAGKPLTLRTLTDMLCPLVKLESESAEAEINWTSNKQGYGMFYHLDNAMLDTLYTKCHSNDVMNHYPALPNGPTTTRSAIMKYTGGFVEYTVMNSSNHTIEVMMNTFKPKRRLHLTLYECWDLDHAEDDTLKNATVPLNVERDKDDYGTPIMQPNNPKSYVKFNYTLVQSKRVVLAVGESFTYTVKHAPFTYDIARENMYHATAGDQLYSPQCRTTSIICRSQLVVDSTGSKVAHGSGKVAVATKFVDFCRSGMDNKRYQTVNYGGLDTLADGDQYHYNVDTEALVQATTT